MRLAACAVWLLVTCFILSADDKLPNDAAQARVFITDSQSWQIIGRSGGANGAFASTVGGGARPQTAEVIKTFGERCPQVTVNNMQEKSDYVVLLDHEGGKSWMRVKNKVAVFTRITGDTLVSKSTHSLGGSVQEACEAIKKDWTEHSAAIKAAEAAATANKPAAVPTIAERVVPAATSAKVIVSSTPDGADIEVNGNFVGNTPSEIQLADGEHTVAVKKSGFKTWERKMKVNSGSNVSLNAQMEKE